MRLGGSMTNPWGKGWTPLGFTVKSGHEYLYYQYVYPKCYFHCMYYSSPVLQIRWGR